MAIYWSKNSIPALQNMPAKESSALILQVSGAVWRRWQVWLPVLTKIILFLSFIFLAPQFEYRILIVFVLSFVTLRIAFLPYHHFLALELEKVKTKN